MSYIISTRRAVETPALCICATVVVSHRCTPSMHAYLQRAVFLFKPTRRACTNTSPCSRCCPELRAGYQHERLWMHQCRLSCSKRAVSSAVHILIQTDEWISEKMKNIYINTEIRQADTQKKLPCQNLIGEAISHKYILLLYSARFLDT